MPSLPALDHRPTDGCDSAAILLHGRGGSPGEMRDIAGALGLMRWRCVFPQAAANSWYPRGFMSPRADNEPDLGEAVEAVVNAVRRLEEEGFRAENVLVGGFSQGACVVCDYLERHPVRHLAALIFSGAFPGPVGTLPARRTELAGMPALVTGSRDDPFVPITRVMETVDWLRGSGADVRFHVFDRQAHAIDEQDVEIAREMLKPF